MFRIFHDTKIDFMKLSRPCLALSATLCLLSVVAVLVQGLNLGIEFTGGTEVQLKYAERPDIGAIRESLGRAGLKADVTTIGEPEENEVYIRLAEGAASGNSGESTGLVVRTLRAGSERAGLVDLNTADKSTLHELLSRAPSLSATDAATVGDAISARRREVALYRAVEDLASVPGVSAEVLEYLRSSTYVGPLTVRSQSYIGPAVGSELLTKALWAIVLSLLAMLVYIWFRFELQWGLAAVVALVHDTLVTLGLFSLLRLEMSLPVVAAFLTLIGYSVNDTVVIFDRIRENLTNRVKPTMEETINLSVNQTLSRSIITSGLTWIMVAVLLVFGGPALRPFSFVLTAGIIVGSYSTIYIASPILIIWGRFFRKRDATKPTAPTAAAPVARRVKKVRTPSPSR